MGTSSRYDGPKGKNSLIPEDYNKENEKKEKSQDIHEENYRENYEENLEEKVIGSRWKDAKTNMTRYLKSEATEAKVVSSYIKALGGAKKAAQNSSGIKKATISLGRLILGVSNEGIKSFLEQNKIQYQNRDAEEVLCDITNLITPSGGTKEEALIRDAMFNTIGELYNSIMENNGDIESLNRLTPEFFNEMMNKFISEIIFQKIKNDLASREEMSQKPAQELIVLEKNIKMYIRGTVEITLSQKDYSNYDYVDNGINGIIEGIYFECFEILEGGI